MNEIPVFRMIDDFVATPIPRTNDGSRYAILSSEEVWVRVCAKFFEHHGNWDWYLIPEDQAFYEMMQYGNGIISPQNLRARIGMLYQSAGVK